MAIYNLKELLSDKDLCKEILKEKFQLCDLKGEFKTLDFAVNSMRKNHILAFETVTASGANGYYAVAKLSAMKIKEMITPFAFTGMDADKWENISCVLLDRFGKKGAFDLKNKTYLIPCMYEEIEFLGSESIWGENAFRVRIMGHEGKIHRDGTWVKHLHRAEE